jgi:hypothetical protein
MTSRWNSEGLNVKYMSWAIFRDTVAAVSEEYIPDSLAAFDLVWGGADFNLDSR